MTPPNYQIVRVDPIYSAINDAMIGTEHTGLELVYQTEAMALRVAGRLTEQYYIDGGDSFYRVFGLETRAFVLPKLTDEESGRSPSEQAAEEP